MGDLNTRPHPILTKSSRIYDRVLNKALGYEINIEAEDLDRGEVEENPALLLLSSPISCFHAANGLQPSQNPESELPKDLLEGFTRMFLKVTGSLLNLNK